MEDNEKRQLQDKIDDYKKAIRTLEESKDEINYQDNRKYFFRYVSSI